MAHEEIMGCADGAPGEGVAVDVCHGAVAGRGPGGKGFFGDIGVADHAGPKGLGTDTAGGGGAPVGRAGADGQAAGVADATRHGWRGVGIGVGGAGSVRTAAGASDR